MGAILKIKGAGGGTISVPALQGASAYELAVLGGYEGSEEEFASSLANLANGGTGTLNQSGSASQPVYIKSDGTVAAISYTINSNVPSGAKFTDTTYSAASGGGLSLSGTVFSLATISGLTASSYGPSTNKTLTYGGTFTIPYVTVNAKGQVTGISTKTMTMPAAPSSDSGISLVEAGSTTQPIYINSDGIPTATTYTLGKSVPGDAVFTDTTYNVATSSSNGLMSSSDKTELDKLSTGRGTNYSYVILTPSSSSGNYQVRAITHLTADASAGTGTNLVTISTLYYTAPFLNGSKVGGSSSFYAPTSVGTSGQFLKSSGSGAPTWTTVTIPSITLNGVSTTSPSFYAPTSAGTSGYYLKSNGSGAPTWAAISTGGSTVSISNRQTSGTRLATLTIDGTGYDLYYTNTNTNTTYSAGTGLTLSSTTFSLTQIDPTARNSSGTTVTASNQVFGPGVSGNSGTLSNGSTFYVPGFKIDQYGRVTDVADHLYTLSVSDGTSYTAGTGISISSGTISLTSGVMATGSTDSVIGSSADSTVGAGDSFYCPGFKVDTYGRVTAVYDRRVFLSSSLGSGGGQAKDTSASISYPANSGAFGGSNSNLYGQYNFAFGKQNFCGGQECNMAFGEGLAAYYGSFVVGQYNKYDINDSTYSVFCVGIGTGNSYRTNGFRVNKSGNCYAQSSSLSTGADFAEYFEWGDANPANEDRRGRFVTLDNNKIRLANINDEYIIGVITGKGAFIGNSASEQWEQKYLTDIFGTRLAELKTYPPEYDEEGNLIKEEYSQKEWIINPEWDESQEYISREERPEWDPVGLVGQVVVIDDGTCEAGGFCKPIVDGIATSSESGYYVMKRLDATHIKILLK